MIWRYERTDRWRSAGLYDCRGFTLIEVLVVLAIMVLVVAIVVPMGVGERAHARIAAGAHEIAEGLRLTRSRAILTDRAADFLVDVNTDTFRVAGAMAPVALPRDLKITLSTTEDLLKGDSIGAIRFYPDGSSTGGGVTLVGAEDRYLVAVDWLTGGISIHQQHASPRP